MTTDTAAKRNTQKLQRAIVDGLEDVKAQDIRVFDTEHLSPLFERVIVASGTSNRQTKALAASVRDKVREAGFPKPRVEGEANGEWIIVDCAQAVVHIMQPTFRTYYHLEELWGEKPVRLKFGATRPVVQGITKNRADAAKSRTTKAAPTRTSPGNAAPTKLASAPTPKSAGTRTPAAAPKRVRAAAATAPRKAASAGGLKSVTAKTRPAPARASAKSAPRKTPARKA